MSELGKVIRTIREARGFQLGELALAAGISNPFLSLVERGQRQPSIAVLHRLAAGLGIPTDVLILCSAPTGSHLRSSNPAALRVMLAVGVVLAAERELSEVLQKRKRLTKRKAQR